MSSLISAETMKAHRARWYVYSGGGASGTERVKLPRSASMRGHWPGWDVTCSCGWESMTGGATRNSVANDLWFHRYQAQETPAPPLFPCDQEIPPALPALPDVL